ncbi:MAG TPA: multiheme c-type cytochrome [Pirellulales bacterium]|nr:multiheme c-type cytochrome [Pirellulales bacterium]
MQGRVSLALVAGSLALCGWVVLRLIPSRPLPSAPADSPAAHDAAETHEVESSYVGVATCAECHADEFRSYQKTAHSQALAELDLQAEPPDGQFEHRLSGRSYRVYRADGAFRHRERLASIDDDGLTQDYAVKYLIGSGRHTRSYLIEDDGFLIESPITWYVSRKAWGMSPGYDRRSHWGFERATDMGCLACHVGRAENVDGALNRIAIHEQAIGCEACHGPGSQHAAARRAAKTAAANDRAAASEKIVHPGKLARELSEAICAQCHLRSDATVFVRGRSVADFRPGQPLSDYRIDYRLDRPSSRMKVVGHVEQMRLSRCYQQSDALTCTTCHNPHAPASPEIAAPERAATAYRSKCLECHAPAACGLKVAERTKTEPGDNCAACHMPQSPTDIPHIAFTHHRIGIHRPAEETPVADQKNADEPGFGDLTPLSDLSHLPEIERDRCLGLAYLEFAQKQDAPASEHYRRRAVELLESVRDRGLRDAYVEAGLARMYWSSSPPRAAQLALAALEDDPLPPSERANSLFVLADVGFRSQQWAAAQSALAQLVRLRRHPVDWLLLGLCQAAQGDEPGAIKSLERAAEINPYQRDVHEQLARLYTRQRQTELAERQRQLAKLLEESE